MMIGQTIGVSSVDNPWEEVTVGIENLDDERVRLTFHKRGSWSVSSMIVKGGTVEDITSLIFNAQKIIRENGKR